MPGAHWPILPIVFRDKETQFLVATHPLCQVTAIAQLLQTQLPKAVSHYFLLVNEYQVVHLDEAKTVTELQLTTSSKISLLPKFPRLYVECNGKPFIYNLHFTDTVAALKAKVQLLLLPAFSVLTTIY
jgi:hypothetical protein